jgi:hypothetical protein
MNRTLKLATLTLAALTATAQPPADKTAHMRYQRDLAADPGARLNHAVVDATLWRHARADLSDLRLFADANEVPYVLVVERGRSSDERRETRFLNRGVSGGVTEMTLAAALPEYDHLEFQIEHRGDFLARATLAGANEANAGRWTELGSQTIFSLQGEGLGRNTRFRLKSPATFRFLRVRFSAPLLPEEVTGAYHELRQEEAARYQDLDTAPAITTEGKKTVVRWTLDGPLPLDRVTFEVDAAQANFSRAVTITCDGRRSGSGEISRIRLERRGQRIESEDLAVSTGGVRCHDVRIEIENGDDRPLDLRSVRAQMLERRLYFQPAGAARLTLYYGDDKLGFPRYDFGRYFAAADAAESRPAVWAPETANASFTERPDERPWSERYPALVWAAMVLAVVGLGYWAIQGFKKA